MARALWAAPILALAIAGAAQACPSGTCPTAASSPQSGARPVAAPEGPAVAPLDLAAPSTAATQAGPAQDRPTQDRPTGDYLQRERLECSDFDRNADGSWLSLKAVAIPAPEGPLKIDVGTAFRPGQFAGGYDLGSMLERDCPGYR